MVVLCDHACCVFCCAQMNDDAPCHVGMVTTWSGDLWGIRREMLPWITYHAQLGVSKIYVLYDGTDRNTHTVGAWFAASSYCGITRCSM
jgi:hypothetical protein